MLALLRKIVGDEYLLLVEAEAFGAGWNSAVDRIAEDAKEILKEIDVTKPQRILTSADEK